MEKVHETINLGFGRPLFDFNNPIAQKGEYRVCSENLVNDNNQKVYTLYHKLVVIGFFITVALAKQSII